MTNQKKPSTAVSEAELRCGAAILPAGRRRENLMADIEGMLREAFGERVLPFDRAAAREYADIAATRNVRDFDGIGVDIVNPWNAA
ncbi:MAG: type II toxin-antitoxin system VapC family toxin [Proteobacteria bacterium]|nr:type II toxin-antitoxin system VapC family toxin [Pseudomonadota bacterium]MYJ96970.1 type II toxin-antitoxin system VapC family toxin [Pseudomonadota bacterium]